MACVCAASVIAQKPRSRARSCRANMIERPMPFPRISSRTATRPIWTWPSSLSSRRQQQPEKIERYRVSRRNIMNQHGVVHFEIPADDPEKLVGFYKQLFGWEVDKMDMEGMPYWSIRTGPHDPTTMMPKEPGYIG